MNVCMERVKGIEPSSSAWKAEVLPLNYTRMLKFVEPTKLIIYRSLHICNSLLKKS